MRDEGLRWREEGDKRRNRGCGWRDAMIDVS